MKNTFAGPLGYLYQPQLVGFGVLSCSSFIVLGLDWQQWVSSVRVFKRGMVIKITFFIKRLKYFLPRFVILPRLFTPIHPKVDFIGCPVASGVRVQFEIDELSFFS